MVKPKHEIKNLLILVTKNCETLIEQTQKKQKKHWNLNLTNQENRFFFKPPIQNKGNWMLRLTILESYNSISSKSKKMENFNFVQTLLRNFCLKN